MKAKFLALAALVLGLVSCQNEPEGLGVNVGGEQDVVLTVSLPEATRVGTQDSALGGVTNVLGDYDLRYILEIYNESGVMVQKRDMQVSDQTTVVFPLRLIPNREYHFVVWADFVQDGSEADNYYDTSAGLRNVSIVDAKWNAMDEARDAYTGVKVIEDFSKTSSIDLVLTRPFGKLRVVTTDIAALYGILPEGIDVDYSVPVYKSFDAFNAQPYNAVNKQFAFKLSEDSEYEDLTDENERTLFADYLFGTESATIQFHMDVLYADLKSTTSLDFNTQIPVERNKLTTLMGNLLTNVNDITITVDENFDTFYTEDTTSVNVANAQELRDAIAAANNTTFTTINLAKGTYTGAFNIQSKKVILLGEDKDETIIDGLVHGLSASVIVRNLTLTNATPAASGVANRGNADYYCLGAYASCFVVDNCIFNVSNQGAAAGKGAINIYAAFNANPETYDLTVTNCVFNCNGERPIRCRTNTYINGCTFVDQYRYAVQFQANKDAASEVFVFTNNTLTDPCQSSGQPYVAGVSISKAQLCEDVALTISGNTTNSANPIKFVYDDDANVKITTCTLNGDLVAAEQCVVVESGVKEVLPIQTISTKAELFAFADEVNNNNKSYKIIRLGADIDLENEPWTPIGQTGQKQFAGVFDGNGHVIKNLNIDKTSETGGFYSSGLFGWLNGAVVKNVTIVGATVKGNHNVAVIAGYMETTGCTIENCHVKNATVKAYHANDDACGDKVGGIVGYAGNSGTPIKDCTVVNSAIYAGRDAGQIVGATLAANVINCSATSVTVAVNPDTTCTDGSAGNNIREEVIGRLL